VVKEGTLDVDNAAYGGEKKSFRAVIFPFFGSEAAVLHDF
jgi:hypothetical protein